MYAAEALSIRRYDPPFMKALNAPWITHDDRKSPEPNTDLGQGCEMHPATQPRPNLFYIPTHRELFKKVKCNLSFSQSFAVNPFSFIYWYDYK